MSTITIIFEQDNIKTSLIVRSKTGKKPSSYYNVVPHIPIDNTLNFLGLERVPYAELVPKCRRIKCDDSLLGKSCNICQIEYKNKEYQRELKCKHAFHKRCIDKWMKNNLTCPLCRTSIG